MTQQMPLPLRFACDSLPDCQGQIVERVGDFVIIEGMATDSGYWFAKGDGGARRFGKRQEAVDYIEYAQDARPIDTRAPGSGPMEDLTNTKYGQKGGKGKGKGKDVSVSEAQHRAMGAAAGGHSNLGIPRKVGEEFSKADKGKFDSADGGPGSGPSEGSSISFTGPHSHDRNKEHYRGLQMALTKAALRGDKAEVSELKAEMSKMLPEIKRKEPSFR